MAATVLSGCAGRQPAIEPGAPLPSAVIPRFLDLANQQRLREMSWVFGTKEGPFAKQSDQREAELRMYLFSCVLRHDSYEIRSEQPVPGSIGKAVIYQVVLNQGRVRNVVPFRVVRAEDDRWYLEDFRIEVLTNSRAPVPRECRGSPALQ